MTRVPIRLAPDPGFRYLRGRGNRRVRKAHRLRGLLRMWRMVLVDLAVAAMLLYVGVRAVRHLATSREFALDSVQVEGTRRTTPDEVRSGLREFEGRNLFRIDLDEVARRCAEDRWVQSATVKRILPNTLRVHVTERTPAALAVLGGGVFVLDATGATIGPVGPDLAENLPVITGVERLRGDALRTAVSRGVLAIRRLEETTGSFLDQVSELDLSHGDRIEISTRAPGPRILLDPEEVERNVASYLDLRRTLEEEAGPAAVVDLRWRDRISVLPKDNESESD